MAVAALAASAGCGGAEEEPADAAAPSAGAVPTAADPAPGRLLRAFVGAARRSDEAALWNLLSTSSRAGLGGTVAAFRRDAGEDLVLWLGRVRPGERVVLSQRVGRRWAVAAIAGVRVAEDESDDFAYAAAFRREAGRWRIDLGGVVVGGVRPEPLEVADAEPELRADVAAGANVRTFLLWLDGRALDASAEAETPFAARVRAAAPEPVAAGRHVGIAFAATATAAAAVAWPFSVEP